MLLSVPWFIYLFIKLNCSWHTILYQIWPYNIVNIYIYYQVITTINLITIQNCYILTNYSRIYWGSNYDICVCSITSDRLSLENKGFISLAFICYRDWYILVTQKVFNGLPLYIDLHRSQTLKINIVYPNVSLSKTYGSSLFQTYGIRIRMLAEWSGAS